MRGPVKDSNRRPYHERPRVAAWDDDPIEHPLPSISVEVISSEEEVDGDDDLTQPSHNDIPDELVSFEAWLQSADGGKLDEKTSRQHTKQVFKLLNAIDEKHELVSLFDDRLINDRFLEGHANKSYTPKTTQSYLMSLRHFYSFSLTGAVGVPISKENIISLKDKVSRWSSSYRGECSKRHWEKMSEDLVALITPEQIKKFESSQASRDAICLLGQLSGAHNVVITQAQYTLIRDFLLVEISIDNANRAGSLANMTLEEFNSMTKENDEYLVLVRKSKTLSTHGPARIVLSKKLRSWMQIYVREVRSQVTGSNNQPNGSFFLSFNGEPMASSQINKAIKSIWKKAELKGTPSSTLFRKSAVSSMHSLDESNEARENLADLMAHNLSTAKKYYRLQEKSKSSVSASKQLRQIMRREADSEKSSSSNQFEVETPKVLEGKQFSNSESCDAFDDSSNLSTPVERAPGKVPWNKDKEFAVENLFKEEIQNQSVSMEIIRAKISANDFLKNEDPKRILDKVRSKWRFPTSEKAESTKAESSQAEAPPFEEESIMQKVNRAMTTTTEASGIRHIFSPPELDALRSAFSDMIKKSAPISKPKVKEILQKENWGKQMLEKASLDTVVNRIKYERRMVRSKELS